MAERKVSWKPRKQNALIGKPISRIDGVEKASGAAKYAADINTPGTLFARLLTCNLPAAKVARLNVEPAKKIKGVHAVEVFNGEGKEIRWDGTLIAAVAAERPEIAQDAIRAIEVEYEPLDFWVDESDLKGAEEAGRTKPANDNKDGDASEAMKSAEVVHKGHYGIHTITHMCMEPHGSHCEWTPDGKLVVHLSTQNVSGTAGQFAGPLEIDAANVTVICNYIGGGFGSKFAADEWGLACARLAKTSGRPVRLLLDRAAELKIAGTRPSSFADVTIGADKTGRIVAWESHHWGTSGFNGSTVSVGQMPYLFAIPNRNSRATGIVTNTGPNRAWRAPNHPQACAMTNTAIDDLAAKLEMDSYEVFLKNLDQTAGNRSDIYEEEMKIGAELIGWKDKWHAHGKGPKRGSVVQGLGMALHTWGGRAHAATCTVRVYSDGTVESLAGTQDLGTGTRTVIALVLAETFGIPVSKVKVTIGNSSHSRSGPSGGSTTVGGVSGPNRRAALAALWQIFDKVAERFDVKADTLEAKNGQILSKGVVVCSWDQAAHLVGPMPLEVKGEGPADDGLTSDGVGGIQMADVSVDTETGLIRVNKLIAVQDCGLIIDLKTAKSQVLGGLIMGIAYSLTEERVMDNATGRFINADLENYKLPRIGDIGELVAEMYQPDSQYERGVIGLGEPPVISTGAALSNAVANALGVRIPVLPMTPQRVLAALKGGQA